MDRPVNDGVGGPAPLCTDLRKDRVKSHGWRELERFPLSAEVTARRFTKGECMVIVSQEPHGREGTLKWHLSISHPSRYPGWEEIKDARYSLLPLGLTFAQILPPPGEYVNIHRNCFHLWEIGNEEW
jgi:hypothetical protein